MSRTGDWKKLRNVMQRYEKRVMKNCTVALMRAGLKLEAIIKDRIIDGKGMSTLHGFTIEQKGSSKPLIDDGDLLSSVGLRVLARDAVFVGVHRKSEDGTDIAEIHEREEGTRIKVTPKMRAYLHAKGFHLKPETEELFIPGRPFIMPSYRDFKERGIAKELFSEAVEKTLKAK
jgi:hypothetical protein